MYFACLILYKPYATLQTLKSTIIRYHKLIPHYIKAVREVRLYPVKTCAVDDTQ